MNEVYNDGTRIIHDDREFITPEEAFDILFSGKSIQICDPPDYGAENDWEVHSMPYTVLLKDVLSAETLENMNSRTDEQLRAEVFEYLRGYELSR